MAYHARWWGVGSAVLATAAGCAAGAPVAVTWAEPGSRVALAVQEWEHAPAEGAASTEGTPGRIPLFISVGGGFGSDFSTSVGYIGFGECELGLGKEFGLGLRAIGYGYAFDDGEDLAPGTFHEEETGTGFGLGGEWRWYTSGKLFTGFYLGAGASLFFISEWENKEDANGDGVFQPSEIDDGSTPVFELHGTLGVAIPLGPQAGIRPFVIFGNYFGEVGGAYGGIGVQGGVRF